MTGRRVRRPGAIPQRPPLDLSVEVVRLDAEAEQWQSQHGVAAEGEGILTQGIADDVLRPVVVYSVDLDDESVVGLAEVQVAAPACVPAQRLPLGDGHPATAELGSGVELAE